MRGPVAMTPERTMYDFLQKKFPNKLVTQSYLKSIITLGQTSNLQFPILRDEGNLVLGDKRLQRSDAFWAMSMGLFISKVANAASVASLREHTFVNPGIFTDATEEAALNTLYNGELNIRVARTNVYQGLDLKRFRRVGVAQETLEVSTGATNPAYFASEWEANEGLYTLTPHVLFSGQSTAQVTAELAESVNMASPAGSTNYAILYFRGFFIADGANLGGGSEDQV